MKARRILKPILAMTLLLGTIIMAEAATKVTSFSELKEAVQDPTISSIVISGDIEITEGIILDRSLEITGEEGHSCTISKDMEDQDTFTITGDVSVTVKSLDIIDEKGIGDLAFYVNNGANAILSGNKIICNGATGGIGIEGASAKITDNKIFAPKICGIVLGAGAKDVTIKGNEVKYATLGIFTYNEEREQYAESDYTVKNISIEDNYFDRTVFGAALLPNVENFSIEANSFDCRMAGVITVPLGVCNLENIIEESSKLDTAKGINPEDLAPIQKLAESCLVFPEKGQLPKNITIKGNKFLRGAVGTALVGVNDAIRVENNSFGNTVGLVGTAFPGKIISDLFNAVINSSCHLPYDIFDETIIMSDLNLSEIELPTYETDFTAEGNNFNSNVGIISAFNTSADITKSKFQRCIVGIAMFPGSGKSEVKENTFKDCFNGLVLGDMDLARELLASSMTEGDIVPEIPSWEEISDDLGEKISQDLYELLVDQVNAIELAPSKVLIQSNDITVRENGMILAASKADTMVRFNEIKNGFGSAIMVGAMGIHNGPGKLSISENTFSQLPVMKKLSEEGSREDSRISNSFINVDVPSIKTDWHVNLNVFESLEEFSLMGNYAVIASADKGALDCARNTWISSGKSMTSTELTDSKLLKGPIVYEPVYGAGDIDEAPSDLEVVSKDIEGATVYTGETEGDSFEVEIPHGTVKPTINKVDEEVVKNAMTAEELAEMDEVNRFYVPLDIKFQSQSSGRVTFRFKNTQNLDSKNLIVVSTTPSGVMKWSSDNMSISEDGQWIVLEVGQDTIPSFSDLKGSVTIAGSKTGTSGGSSSGGCNIGYAPAALLLILPLITFIKH